MKYGNFIIVFFGKSVFYYSDAEKVHVYGWKGRFFKNMTFFVLRDIHIFFWRNIFQGTKGQVFFECHFLILQGYVSKNSKNKTWDILRLRLYIHMKM